jgi:hypothetical protein
VFRESVNSQLDWSGFTETGDGNRSGILALSHFQTENRCPPLLKMR